MYDHRLPKTVRNTVLDAIEAAGMDPRDFAWSDQKGSREYVFSRITHVPTGYMFEFAASSTIGGTYLTAKWSPADRLGQAWLNVDSRDEQLRLCIESWIPTVKAESDAPDKWAALTSETFLASEVADKDQRFTPDELQQLREGLKLLQEHLVRATRATHEQQVQINVTFQETAKAAERLTKRDWNQLFLGALIQQLVAIGADPAVFHSALQLANRYIWPLLGQLRALTGL